MENAVKKLRRKLQRDFYKSSYRSSHPENFCKITVLTILEISQGNVCDSGHFYQICWLQPYEW